MKYLIAVLLSALFCALTAPKTPALTKTVVHRNVSTVTPTTHIVTSAKTVQPQPENKTVVKAAAAPSATSAPQPKTVTPTYPVSCSAYEPIVAQYNWNVQLAMAIMQAESGCNPYAISNASINYDGVSDYGLFQIHGRDVLEPAANIAIAYQKYQSQGWAAWSTYNSGAVWRYYQ